MVALQRDEDIAWAWRQEQLIAVGAPHVQVLIQRRVGGLGEMGGAAQGAVRRMNQQVEHQALGAGCIGADDVGHGEESYYGCL
ncbi:hypothetical protein D3C84_1046780 [compost metagenome]